MTRLRLRASNAIFQGSNWAKQLLGQRRLAGFAIVGWLNRIIIVMKIIGIDLKAKNIIVSLIANFLLSWTILPVLIPPIRIYSLGELIEVLLWQGVGFIGWPIALLGSFLSFLFQFKLADLVTLLFILIYPSMWFLLLCVWRSKRFKRQAFVMLHFLLTISFAAIWYQVLNGYDFMIG